MNFSCAAEITFIDQSDIVPPSFPHATRSNSTIVSLPVEVWLEVFAFASYVPGIYEISDSRTIEAFSSDSNGIVLDNLVSTAMSTKRTISEVCRTWWGCIQPFLFEHIRIKSGAHALVVAERLGERNKSSGNRCHPGRWVKRLEIISEDHYWDEERVDALLRILDCTPNIAVFSDLFCCSPSSILDAETIIMKLVELCNLGSLRRLEWYSGSPTSLNRLLEQLAALEVLIIGRGFITSESDGLIDLPNLTTLVAGEYASPSRYQDLHCPSLKSFIVHRSVMPDSKYNIRDYFSITGGLQHMRLRLEDWKTNYVNICAFPDLNALTVDFGRHYSNMTTKNLNHNAVERLNFANFPLFYHASLWHDQYTSDSWKAFMTFTFGLLEKANLPSLKSIGFLVPDQYFTHGPTKGAPPGLMEFWEPWVLACESRGIIVEESLGLTSHVNNDWKPFCLY